MAYMDQGKKAAIRAELVKVVPKGWKWSLGVRNHSTIVLNVSAGPIDLPAIYSAKSCGDGVRKSILESRYCDVNPYNFRAHFDGELLEIFVGIFAALNLNNHDRSDITTDYFDVGHYVDVNLGKWDKPFEVR